MRIILTQAKSFVSPLLSQLAPSTLLSSEHFMLKDLPFYEVARFANAEIRQACLDAREKKHQEGTLCQVPSSTSQVTSSLTPKPAKKKIVVRPQAQKIVTKTDEMFEAGLTEWYEIVELVVLSIIEEVKEEEMVANQ